MSHLKKGCKQSTGQMFIATGVGSLLESAPRRKTSRQNREHSLYGLNKKKQT